MVQHIEDKHIKHLLDTKDIIYYTRYVDDILVIYDTRHINYNAIQNYIKQIHNNILLNPTKEDDVRKDTQKSKVPNWKTLVRDRRR